MMLSKADQKFMHHIALMLAFILALPVAAQGAIYTVDVQDWLKIRHGDNLMSHPSLHAVMIDWMNASTGSYIEICHAEQESLAEWALELLNRLVAFGVPSRHLKLQIEDMDNTLLGLRVVRSKAVQQ